MGGSREVLGEEGRSQMFFIIGISEGRKGLVYELMVQCPHCGRWERCEIQMGYICLTLFFIPTLRWNRRYLLRMRCCGAVFELDGTIGREIAKGQKPQILAEHLRLLKAGRVVQREEAAPVQQKLYGENTRVCPDCGAALSAEFQFCPKCGKPLKWA